jgi:serine/threonine-protein kinase SRK2
MNEIKRHPWFLKNLPTELGEEKQSSYMRGSCSGPPYSKQTNQEIMRMVEDAKTRPRLTGVGYGYGDEGYDEEEKEEANELDQSNEEDDCEKQVREVLDSGELDLSSLRV